MRITVITSSYPRFLGDGTAPFVRSISERMVDLGHAVEVVAPYDPAVTAESGDQRVSVHRFRYTLFDSWHIMGHANSLVDDARLKSGAFFLLPFFLLAQFQAAFRIALRQEAELIHTHWVLPNGVVGVWLSRMLGIPLAVSLHGSDIFVAQRNTVFSRVAWRVFQEASVITACSDGLRRKAINIGASPDKIHLIAWGADPVRFNPAVTALDRSKFGLTGEDVLLIALGRIVPKKGFDVLVRSLPSLLSLCPQAQMLIGGDGAQRDELRRLAESLGISDRVHFPGRIPWDQVPGFLNMGDIFVLPSVHDAAGNVDGLPTVLLEAMGCGKPIVATTVGGVPLVIEDQVNGLLCPPGDPGALSQTLARIIEDDSLRAQLGQEARSSVEERFNWSEVAQKMVMLFQQAAEQ